MASIYTTAGRAKIVDIIDGTAVVPTYYIGWGTGSGTAAVGDTTLFTEASESRVAASLSQPLPAVNMFTGTITANGTKTITNVGLFDASTSGTLISKTDLTGNTLSVTSGQTLTIRFTFSAM